MVTIGRSRKSRRLLASAEEMIGSACSASVSGSGREAMRQMKFANDDLDIDAKIIFVADNFYHPPARILRGRRPVGDFDIDHDIFKVAPVGARGGFFAENAMFGPSLSLCARVSLAVCGSQDFLHRPAEIARRRCDEISPFPCGITISCEIF